MAIARDVARQQRQAEAAHNRTLRDAERDAARRYREAQRAQREYARSMKELEREKRAFYLSEREQEAAELNRGLEENRERLDRILVDTLSVSDTIAFDSLRIQDEPPAFTPPASLARSEVEPQEADYLSSVVPPRGLSAWMPGAKKRHERSLAEARTNYEKASSAWRQQEARRLSELAALESKHAEAALAFQNKKEQRNAEVDVFQAEYRAGDPDAIVAYYSLVLERSVYPDDFPQNFSIAYTAASKQLVVEYELPGISIVPAIAEYRYVRSTDTITGKPRKEAEIKDIYQELIASVALRNLHEIFEADQADHVTAVCFNGYIHTVDPATGHDVQPHLISVRTAKERFEAIDLSRVDKRVCLKNLGAQVSRRPDEAQPVKPIVEFKMADARFVDQTDLVSGLSSATNLMDLNPYEFEHLVANLFRQMGLESKLTRSSRDGGVDCVAYDARPVLGGKVVIQAKRYRHTVGVSAVRDLFGTMMNEGANKGILVTTSGYGPDAFDFAKDKPIELIDGGGLLFLLQEIGVEARIVFPDE